MEKQKIKLASIMLAGLLLSTAIAGCKLGGKETSTMAQNEEKVTFPLKDQITLSYWTPDGINVPELNMKSSELPYYKELEKKTNVKINFIHPVAGQEKEQFNIMIASNEIPDVIEYDIGTNFSGGFERLYKEGQIIDITQYVKKQATNFNALSNRYPGILTLTKNDDGKILFMPAIRGGKKVCTFSGPVVRKDILDELGLQEPTTISEWYNVLKEAKVKKGTKIPYVGKPENFMPSWNLGEKYVDNGKVYYGYEQPQYKEFLETMHQWYAEGLINPDFAIQDYKKDMTYLMEGSAVAGYFNSNYGISYMMNLMKDDANFKLSGLRYPTLNKEAIPEYYMNASPITSSVFLTSKNKNPGTTVAWLDYAYGKEGYDMFNFGLEGKSYTVENSKPRFNDFVLKNPDGKSASAVMKVYGRGTYGGPYVMNPALLDQLLVPEASAAVTKWAEFMDKSNEHRLLANMNTEENEKVVAKNTELATYTSEMQLKFIMGVEPLDKFDQYVDRLKKMGIDGVMSVYQEAYDRFISTHPEMKNNLDWEFSNYYN